MFAAGLDPARPDALVERAAQLAPERHALVAALHAGLERPLWRAQAVHRQARRHVQIGGLEAQPGRLAAHPGGAGVAGPAAADPVALPAPVHGDGAAPLQIIGPPGQAAFRGFQSELPPDQRQRQAGLALHRQRRGDRLAQAHRQVLGQPADLERRHRNLTVPPAERHLAIKPLAERQAALPFAQPRRVAAQRQSRPPLGAVGHQAAVRPHQRRAFATGLQVLAGAHHPAGAHRQRLVQAGAQPPGVALPLAAHGDVAARPGGFQTQVPAQQHQLASEVFRVGPVPGPPQAVALHPHLAGQALVQMAALQGAVHPPAAAAAAVLGAKPAVAEFGPRPPGAVALRQVDHHRWQIAVLHRPHGDLQGR